jgi:hypothetical protein
MKSYQLSEEKITEKIKIDLNNKYFCYILGLIWSDGHICKKYNRVQISLKDIDMSSLTDIFEKVGKWKIFLSDNKKRGYQNQIRLSVSDSKFKKFLTHNDFLEKSTKSPNKLISIIPKTNLKYFFRGISDGDGCFYYNNKNYTRQFVVTSTIFQDWSYFENLMNELDCKYEIIRTVNTKSKYSRIRVSGKNVLTIGNFIYEDFFGLKRKLQKYEIIKDSYLENPYVFRKVRKKKIIIDGVEYESIISAANIFHINRNTLRNRLKNGYYQSNYKEAKMSV